MNEYAPSLEVPTRSPWSEVRLKSSPRGSSDSTSLPLNLDLVLFFLDLEEFGHSILLVSCALWVEHEAHRALFQPRLRTAISRWRGDVSQGFVARTGDWSNGFLGFGVDVAVCYFSTIGGRLLLVTLKMAWVFVGRGFLV